MAKKNKQMDTMAVDLFEREYADQISWRTETLLGDTDEFSDDEYDAAYEQAVDEIAAENGITLL